MIFALFEVSVIARILSTGCRSARFYIPRYAAQTALNLSLVQVISCQLGLTGVRPILLPQHLPAAAAARGFLKDFSLPVRLQHAAQLSWERLPSSRDIYSASKADTITMAQAPILIRQ